MDLLAAVGDAQGVAALAREALDGRAVERPGAGLPGGRVSSRLRRGRRVAPPGGDRPGAKGDYVASAIAYRAALLLDPADADSLNNLGWTLGKLGFFPQAVPPLEKAIALQPTYTLARNNLAWVRSQLK